MAEAELRDRLWPAPLEDGDEIGVGTALLVFCRPGGGSTETDR